MIRTATRRRAALVALLAGTAVAAGAVAATRDMRAGSAGKDVELNGFAGAGTFLNGADPDGPGPDRAKVVARGGEPAPKRGPGLVVAAEGGSKPDTNGDLK
jgi:hypothetical protein